MTKFEYGKFAKFVYRYANFILTPFLFAYFMIALLGAFQNSKFLLPLIIMALLLYVLNRFYFRIYKYFPFTIEIDKEKIVASDFMNRRKKIEIKLEDITEIAGGIFGGNATHPVYIYDGKNKTQIGVNPHLQNFNRFITILLSNIDKSLYERLLKQMEELKKKSRGNKKARH
jgi:hypothetical protein